MKHLEVATCPVKTECEEGEDGNVIFENCATILSSLFSFRETESAAGAALAAATSAADAAICADTGLGTGGSAVTGAPAGVATAVLGAASAASEASAGAASDSMWEALNAHHANDRPAVAAAVNTCGHKRPRGNRSEFYEDEDAKIFFHSHGANGVPSGTNRQGGLPRGNIRWSIARYSENVGFTSLGRPIPNTAAGRRKLANRLKYIIAKIRDPEDETCAETLLGALRSGALQQPGEEVGALRR